MSTGDSRGLLAICEKQGCTTWLIVCGPEKLGCMIDLHQAHEKSIAKPAAETATPSDASVLGAELLSPVDFPAI